MNCIVLPMTLKNINVLNQQYLESYCRLSVSKEYVMFLSNFNSSYLISSSVPLEQTNLVRYIKQIDKYIPESLVPFISYLNNSDPELISTYEFIVSFLFTL